MDFDGMFRVINLRTGNSYVCFTAERQPTAVYRVHAEREYIAVVSHICLFLYEINIPWEVWALGHSRPMCIRRHEKPGNAPRLFVREELWAAKIFSPRDGAMLTEATPKDPVEPFSYFYDRGFIACEKWNPDRRCFVQTFVPLDAKREQVLMILTKGQLRIFDVTKSPGAEVKRVAVRGSFIVSCLLNNEPAYAVAQPRGDLSFHDYNSLDFLRRHQLTDRKIQGLFYYPLSNSLIALYVTEIFLFGIDGQFVHDSMGVTDVSIADHYGDFVIFGRQNGDIQKLRIHDNKFVRPVTEMSAHKTAVSGFGFCPRALVTSSIDGHVIVWSHEGSPLLFFDSPSSVCCCGYLNDSLDLLIATPTEIMIVRGHSVWGDIAAVTDYEEIDPLDTWTPLRRSLSRIPTGPSGSAIIPKGPPMVPRSRSIRRRTEMNPSTETSQPTAKEELNPVERARIIDEMYQLTNSLSGSSPSFITAPPEVSIPKDRSADLVIGTQFPLGTVADTPTETVDAVTGRVNPPPKKEDEASVIERGLRFLRRSISKTVRAAQRRGQREPEQEPPKEKEAPKPVERHRWLVLDQTSPPPEETHEDPEISFDVTWPHAVRRPRRIPSELRRRRHIVIPDGPDEICLLIRRHSLSMSALPEIRNRQSKISMARSLATISSMNRKPIERKVEEPQSAKPKRRAAKRSPTHPPTISPPIRGAESPHTPRRSAVSPRDSPRSPKKSESPFRREILFIEASPSPPPPEREVEPEVHPRSLNAVPAGAVAVAAKEIRQRRDIVVVVRDVSQLDAAMPIRRKKVKETRPRKGRSMGRRIGAMEKRMSGRDEEPDLLGWRGIPRRLPRATVRDIEPPVLAPMESDLHQIDGKPRRLEFAGVDKRDTVFLLAVSKADGQPGAAQTQQPVQQLLSVSDDWRSRTTKQQKSRVFRRTNSSTRPP